MNNGLRLAAIAALLCLSMPAFAHNGLMHTGCAAGQSFTAGAITVSGAYTRAMLPNAGAAGGYLTISNAGAEPDTLTGGTSQAAGLVEVHEMTLEGDMMKMASVPGGLDIPAGGTVALAPKGFHLMMMQIGTPFKEGECVEVTLHFAKAGDLPIQLSIGGIAQDEPVMDHSGHNMGSMSSMETK
jgi:copper(I)-binding protein